MLGLLTAVQNQLRSEVNLSYVGDRDIIITEEEDNFPPGCAYPAILIVDGDIKSERRLGTKLYQTIHIAICIYQKISQEEASLTGEKGVLNITGDVNQSLYNNRLGYTEGSGQIIAAFPCDTEKAKKIVQDGQKITRKKIIYQYERLI